MPDLFGIRPRPTIMFLYYKLSDNFNYNSNGGKHMRSENSNKQNFCSFLIIYSIVFSSFISTDPNGLNHSNNDLLSYTTQRSQLNNNPSISSSSHQTR